MDVEEAEYNIQMETTDQQKDFLASEIYRSRYAQFYQ
jgi:hypothetical protein